MHDLNKKLENNICDDVRSFMFNLGNNIDNILMYSLSASLNDSLCDSINRNLSKVKVKASNEIHR